MECEYLQGKVMKVKISDGKWRLHKLKFLYSMVNEKYGRQFQVTSNQSQNIFVYFVAQHKKTLKSIRDLLKLKELTRKQKFWQTF